MYGAAAVVALLVFSKAHAAKETKNAVQEAIPDRPYDFMQTWWQQLNGTNLTADGSNPNAHPSLADLLTAGIAQA